MTESRTITDIRLANPFTPRFGEVPAYLAGRQYIIDDMVEAFDLGGSNPNLCSLFVGARGTGKTALLTYLGSQAEQLGWITANVTASAGMLEDILQRVHEGARHLISPTTKKDLSGFTIAPIGGMAWDNERPAAANWRSRMNEAFAQLEAESVGILITVDEVNPSLDEMIQLVTTYQHFVREGKKAALLMAGLPHNASSLLSGKSTSFLRRAMRHDLGAIPRYEVAEAFRLTVEDGGRAISDEALSTAVDAIDGFPFMFQLVGYRSWNAAGSGKTLEIDHVRRGIQLAQEELEDRVLNATYSELSKADIAFLRAMAIDEKQTSRADLMERLKKSSSHISTYKKRLLEAGVIEEPQPGTFRFSLPGFREFIKERA